MGAAAIIGAGLLLASQAGQAYSTEQQTKAQQGALNQEQLIQGAYNKNIAQIDAAQMQKESPGAQTQSIGNIAAGLSGQLAGGTANPTAAAAGAAAASAPGSSSGQISQATQGAASVGDQNAATLAGLTAVQRQQLLNQQSLGDWAVNRNRQKNFAQSQASNVYPWMLKAAAGKGASVGAAADLAGTAGAALIGSKGLAKTSSSSAATAGTGATTSDIGLSDPNDLPFTDG